MKTIYESYNVYALKNVFYLMSTMMAAMRPMLASVLVGTHWHVLVKSKM